VTGPGFLLLIRRWWWLLAAASLTAALVAWLIASQAGKTYEADMKLLVGPVSADYPTLQASGELARTYAELAASRPIVEAAAQEARTGHTQKQDETAVSATSDDVTRIVDVRVRHSDPAAAARIAGAVAAQLMQVRRRMPVQETSPVKAIMRDPGLQRLSHAQRRSVRNALARVVWKSNAGDLQLVDRPVPPRDAVAPRVGLLVLLAALGGALVAGVYAIVRDSLAFVSDEGDGLDGFELESFLDSPAGGNGEGGAAAVQRWLDQAPSREFS
jgi:uncharacterized protein involved in exopolysaccharide biosynthesis